MLKMNFFSGVFDMFHKVISGTLTKTLSNCFHVLIPVICNVSLLIFSILIIWRYYKTSWNVFTKLQVPDLTNQFCGHYLFLQLTQNKKQEIKFSGWVSILGNMLYEGEIIHRDEIKGKENGKIYEKILTRKAWKPKLPKKTFLLWIIL